MNRMRLLVTATAALAVAVVAITALSPLANATPKSESVALAVKSDVEHAKKGNDGKWHDAFLPAKFTIKSGAKVTVTVRNYDTGSHTFTSTALGLNVKIKGGSLAHPSLTTFTFTAPKTGTYDWMCMGHCDTWSMTHYGFMRGKVTVTA